MNVVSLFGTSMQEEAVGADPMQALLDEGQMEDFDLVAETPKVMENRLLVSDNQFPDQSMFVLEQQLNNLKSNLNRIKFYLGDLEDLLPR